uniref:OCEL domain-containing protein n=1 Tax=Syphacia muris TaxID=451379 RepID=A0A0N5ARX6_9BILA
MTSPPVVGTMPSFEVLKLHSNSSANKGHMALLVKLTEECLTALNNANKNRVPIRMTLDSQSGNIEVGTGEHSGKFRFVAQQIPGTPSCCIVSDRHKNYCLSALFQSKIQVQATSRSFAETREKAQKIVEEEKKKALKDVSQRHDRRRPVTVKKATNQIAIGAQRPSPSSSAQQKPHLSEFAKSDKISLINADLFQLSNGYSNGSNATGLAGARSIVRAEISRKPLRKRVIHLVLLGKFSTFEEVVTQLKKDSVNVKEESTPEALKAKEILEEVTEINRNTGRLQLKQSLYNEVDPRWPGFNSEEKAAVRKILAGNMGSNNFAPIRRNGIAPPIAPSASHTNTSSNDVNGATNISSPSLANNQKFSSSSRKSSPKISSPDIYSSTKKIGSKASPQNINNSSSNNKKSSPPLLNSSNNINNSCNNSNSNNNNCSNTSFLVEETSPTPVSTAKRKAHSSSTMETAQKRVHFSLPECCEQGKRFEQNVGDKASVNNASSSLSMTASCQPSKDWSREFGEARTHSDALRYYNLFNADYPLYMQYFKRVNAVANEFIELQKQLNERPKHHDHEEIVRILNDKIMQYKADVVYLRDRQMHNDLRAKLDVLKKRIISWEAGCNENEASEPELESHATADGNLMVK